MRICFVLDIGDWQSVFSGLQFISGLFEIEIKDNHIYSDC